MKKFLSVLLCGILVFFAGCTGSGEPSVGSLSEPGGEKVIRLVTDLGKNTEVHGIAPDTYSAQYALEQSLAELGELPEGYRVEVEVLPTDEAEYQSRLTRLRTEIMSGQGPDIYVLSVDETFWWDAQERLFPDPNKAMMDGYFLKLDDYVKNAEFMELEAMNPVVMDAGCTEDGRFILPMRYNFCFAWINEPFTDPGGS
ncbi:MAG: hypothetical protein J1E06_08170 [Acutalibacter sp.]|nr:hypothetical protein [Acutalibacter sp.]